MPQRHQLIYLRPESISEIKFLLTTTTSQRDKVLNWFEQNLPAIYPRQTTAELQLALVILVNGRKQRVSLKVDQKHVLAETALPTLQQIAANHAFEVNNIQNLKSIRIYGSHLWQYLSDQPYVTAKSDLDLLIEYTDLSLLELKNLCEQLVLATKKKIDGEIRFPGLGEIAIGELLNPTPSEFLVKTVNDVSLYKRTELYASYPTLCP